jgi:high-affinity Fe2+/Pb2+ permease
MGFGGYIGGLSLCGFAVILAVFGFTVLIGLIPMIPASFNLILGVVILFLALILFLYGWYLYQSSKPKGTINVHNV